MRTILLGCSMPLYTYDVERWSVWIRPYSRHSEVSREHSKSCLQFVEASACHKTSSPSSLLTAQRKVLFATLFDGSMFRTPALGECLTQSDFALCHGLQISSSILFYQCRTLYDVWPFRLVSTRLIGCATGMSLHCLDSTPNNERPQWSTLSFYYNFHSGLWHS